MLVRRRIRRQKIALPEEQVIKVKLIYLNESEREKLGNFPTGATIQKLASTTVEIPMAEFLTYYLFYKRRHNPEIYYSYSAVRRQLYQAEAALENLAEFSHGSIRIPASITAPSNETTEHIGEAVGLSVVSRIHELTEADWKPIPQQYGRSAQPTFDFSLASDSKGLVELEAKGTVVPDNRIVTTSIRTHAHSIRQKKHKLAASPQSLSPEVSYRLRYGTIAAVDRRTSGRARCWIMDPPAEEQERKPRTFRLIRRLYYLRNWISLVAPRSALAAALATRVASIGRMNDPFELDGLSLLRGTGEPFVFEQASGHFSFFNSRSRVVSLAAGGVVDQFSEDSVLFLGVRESLLTLAVDQNFESILSFREVPRSIESEVECVVPVGRMPALPLAGTTRAAAIRRGGYYQFSLSGRLHVSPGGIVFGQLFTHPND